MISYAKTHLIHLTLKVLYAIFLFNVNLEQNILF